MTMQAVIFCGSRNWTDDDAIRNRMRAYRLPNVVVIHGDCRGADRIAGNIARVLGATVIEMPAQWKLHGDAAGPMRNGAMLTVLLALKACGYKVSCEAFTLPESKGTLDMIERCQMAQVPTTETKGRS